MYIIIIRLKNRESILLKLYRSVFLNNTQFHKIQLHLKVLNEYFINNSMSSYFRRKFQVISEILWDKCFWLNTDFVQVCTENSFIGIISISLWTLLVRPHTRVPRRFIVPSSYTTHVPHSYNLVLNRYMFIKNITLFLDINSRSILFLNFSQSYK